MAESALRQWLDNPVGPFWWIEFEDYARRVFANNTADWYRDAALYAATISQAAEVIPTRCISVDITAPCVAGLTDKNPQTLTAALSTSAALTFVDTILDALLHRFSGQRDVVLKVRSPADLLGDNSNFDDLDEVASGITALLRHCSDKAIAGLLLATAGGTAIGADEVDACEPLLGTAGHYQWFTALAFEQVSEGGADSNGLDAQVLLLPATAVAALPGDSTTGGGLDVAFAGGADLTAGPRLLYGTVPAGAEPEAVRSVLGRLPAQGGFTP